MKKSAKAIKRPLKRMNDAAEEGIIHGEVFGDDEIASEHAVETAFFPTMLQVTNESHVLAPIEGVINVEDLPTSLTDEAIEAVHQELFGDEEEEFPEIVEISIDDEVEEVEEVTSVLPQFNSVEPGVVTDVEDVSGEPASDIVVDAVDVGIPEQEESDATPEDIERAKLMEEITQYVTLCGYMQDHLNRATNMTLVELREYAHAMRINSGGSVTVAQLLAETEEDFHRFISSEDVQRKVALAEAKGADFINVAQRIHRILGSDVVINGIRYAEYRDLVKLLIEHTAVVQRGVTAFADILRIEVPERLDLGGKTMPVVEGMPLNTKSTLYILNLVANNIRVWHASSVQADELVKRMNAEIEVYKKTIQRQADENKALHQRVENIRKEYNTRMGDVHSWVLKHPRGFLGKKYFDEPLAYSNLTFYTNIEDALHMKSRISADDLAQRVFERKSEKFTQNIEFEVLSVILAK